MLRMIFHIVSFLLLSACYYSFETGCLYVAQSVDCFREKSKSNFDSYFKEGVGDKQKLLDVKECLGIDENGIPNQGGDIFSPLRDKYLYSHQGDMAVKKFDECMMLKKGYLYDDQ